MADPKGPVKFGERADQHRLYPQGGVVDASTVPNATDPYHQFGVAPVWQPTMPVSPFDGMLWVDTSARASSPIEGDPPYELRRWNSNRVVWELVGYNVMPPAGPNHATGLVGDPGPTPHFPPYYWGDNSEFNPIPGSGPSNNSPLIFGTFTDIATTSIPSSAYPAAPGDDHTSNYRGTFVPLTSLAGNTTFESNIDGTVIGHLSVTRDFEVIAAGPYAGAVFPKQSGWYYVTGHLRWPKHSDITYRSLNLAWTNESSYFPIALAGGLGLMGLTIVHPGSGYTNGAPITVTGGGGSGFAANVVSAGGAILGINVTDVGVGYTSAPTLIPTVGTGGALTGTLPVAISTLAYVFGEDTRNAFVDAPVQQTVHRLQYLTGFNDAPNGGTPVWMTAMQGSGVSLSVPDPRGSGALPLNDYFGALSLFKVNPLGTNPYGYWVPGLPG